MVRLGPLFTRLCSPPFAAQYWEVIRGIVYTRIDPAGGWKTKLGQELKASGITVDLNDIRLWALHPGHHRRYRGRERWDG